MGALAYNPINNINVITSITDYRKAKENTNKPTPPVPSQDRWVDPIRNREDQEQVIQFLHDKAKYATRKDTRLAAYRDYLYFIMGITSGFRVPDLTTIKWDDIFLEDMKTFRDFHNIKESKTGKNKHLILTDALQIAVMEYIERLAEINIIPEADGYVFIQGRKNENGEYDCIGMDTVSRIVKGATKHCNLKGKFAARSIRKTCAWNYYNSLMNSNNPITQNTALLEVQRFLGHWKSETTLAYLGITRDVELERVNKIGDGYIGMMESFMSCDSLLGYMEMTETM